MTRPDRPTSSIFSAALVLPAIGESFRKLDPRQLDDDELGDPHARLDDEPLATVGVEQDHLHLASIALVDQAGSVDLAEAMLGREAGAWQHETSVPGRDGDRDARADDRACPRLELDALASRQVEPRIASVRPARDDGIRVQPLDGDPRHAGAALSASSPATR